MQTHQSWKKALGKKEKVPENEKKETNKRQEESMVVENFLELPKHQRGT